MISMLQNKKELVQYWFLRHCLRYLQGPHQKILLHISLYVYIANCQFNLTVIYYHFVSLLVTMHTAIRKFPKITQIAQRGFISILFKKMKNYKANLLHHFL